MWTIRQDQVESFRRYHLQEFEDEMVEHLKEFSPQLCKVAGGPAVREVVRTGIDHAREYGLTNRGPVRFYIELMFMFGSSFDTDPQVPWAAATLNNPEISDQMIRADLLYSGMKNYAAQVVGPKEQYAFAALQRLSLARIEDFLVPGKDLEDNILAELQKVYPEKCAHLGELALRTVIQRGLQLADHYRFTDDKGRILIVALTFALGHGFTGDPLYKWVARRLKDKRLTDANGRVEEIYSKALIYLRHALAEHTGE